MVSPQHRVALNEGNVLFDLNLPPKTAANHKRKWVITLAYGDRNLFCSCVPMSEYQ
jgi:hypothetical protein